MKSLTKSICTYCWTPLTKTVKTKDHVPPRCFFTSYEREKLNLITVPSCATCNNSEAVNDEAAKHILLTIAEEQGASIDTIEHHKKTIDGNHKYKRHMDTAIPCDTYSATQHPRR